MIKNCKKLMFILSSMFIMTIVFAIPTFAIWGKTEKGGIYWAYPDGTFEKDGWKLIDDDGDGKGYYYYFNENGFLQIDDITPDYKIVDKQGRQIDYYGDPVEGIIENYGEESYFGVYSEEIQNEITANQTYYFGQVGAVSSGQAIISNIGREEEGPRPSDGIIADDPNGLAKVLLGPGVTLKKKEETKYDVTLDKDMTKYITSSDKFSKKVNGTIFTKNKWKGVMALKGSGATVVFENPKNNFNRLKGRIATHYFTYTDRTTQCVLYIINNDNNEEIYSTSDFNYNGGCRFDCTFYQSVNSIRFELEVSGQYTSRVCYLRDCEYSFDRDMWEEEQYEKEVEAEYIRKYGTESEAEYVEDDDFDDGLGEKAVEGESPTDRYRRLHGLDASSMLPLDYDEDDDSITDAMRASIAELRRQMEEDEEKRNKVSGPAFDENLKNAKPKVGPSGMSNIYEGFVDGEGD